jgi:hypothetical protein
MAEQLYLLLPCIVVYLFTQYEYGSVCVVFRLCYRCLNIVETTVNTGLTQKNGAVSKVNKKFLSHITRAQHTPSAAETVQVSHALPEVRFSCLLRGRGASFKDGVAAGEGFLCAPF